MPEIVTCAVCSATGPFNPDAGWRQVRHVCRRGIGRVAVFAVCPLHPVQDLANAEMFFAMAKLGAQLLSEPAIPVP